MPKLCTTSRPRCTWVRQTMLVCPLAYAIAYLAATLAGSGRSYAGCPQSSDPGRNVTRCNNLDLSSTVSILGSLPSREPWHLHLKPLVVLPMTWKRSKQYSSVRHVPALFHIPVFCFAVSLLRSSGYWVTDNEALQPHIKQLGTNLHCAIMVWGCFNIQQPHSK